MNCIEQEQKSPDLRQYLEKHPNPIISELWGALNGRTENYRYQEAFQRVIADFPEDDSYRKIGSKAPSFRTAFALEYWNGWDINHRIRGCQTGFACYPCLTPESSSFRARSMSNVLLPLHGSGFCCSLDV